MPARGPRWSNQQLDSLIGDLLRTGVVIAATIIACGGALYLVRYGAEMANYHVFHGEPTILRSITGIAGDALTFS